MRGCMGNLALLERTYVGRRAELKRHILLDALNCFNEYGIETTTIEMIRQKSDSSVGAIYHHFQNKEGIVAALFFAAQDDLSTLRNQYLEQASSFEQIISAVIFSYAEWVTTHPDFARFQYASHFSLSHSTYQEQLKQKNQEQIRVFISKLKNLNQSQHLAYPIDLLACLIIGSTENYSRAWLSGKVQPTPYEYRHFLAKAALNSLK